MSRPIDAGAHQRLEGRPASDRIYAPLTLNTGDSIQFDATTPHAIYGGGAKPARVLFSVTDPRWD